MLRKVSFTGLIVLLLLPGPARGEEQKYDQTSERDFPEHD